MEFYPKYPRREQYDLNGMWDFTFVPDLEHPTRPDFDQFAFADQMPVPGVFDIYPDSMAARGTGFYRKIVNISTAGEVLLKLAGLGLWALCFGINIYREHRLALFRMRIENQIGANRET